VSLARGVRQSRQSRVSITGQRQTPGVKPSVCAVARGGGFSPRLPLKPLVVVVVVVVVVAFLLAVLLENVATILHAVAIPAPLAVFAAVFSPAVPVTTAYWGNCRSNSGSMRQQGEGTHRCSPGGKWPLPQPSPPPRIPAPLGILCPPLAERHRRHGAPASLRHNIACSGATRANPRKRGRTRKRDFPGRIRALQGSARQSDLKIAYSGEAGRLRRASNMGEPYDP
jgi:hypothetical protein